jgi:hypothetical protein
MDSIMVSCAATITPLTAFADTQNATPQELSDMLIMASPVNRRLDPIL